MNISKGSDMTSAISSWRDRAPLGTLAFALLCLSGRPDAATLQGTVSGTTGTTTSVLSRATVCLAEDTTSCWLTRANGTFRLTFTPAAPVGVARSIPQGARFSNGALSLPVGAPGIYRLEVATLSGRLLDQRRLVLPEGRQDIRLASDVLAYPGIALLRISGPGGAWNARLVHGKGSVTTESMQAGSSAIAARIASSSALLVSAPGFVTQTVSIPADTTKWSSLAVTLAHEPLQTVRFSADPGPFWSPFSLTLSTTVVNGIVRYTTDGTTPTNLSTGYGSPLTISTDTLLRAQVYQSGVAQGTVQDLGYYKQTLALDKASGSYPGFVHVTASPLNGDERYSLDGSVPTVNSPLWDGKLGLDIYQDAFFVLRTFQAHRVPAAAEYAIIDVTDSSLMPAVTAPIYFYDTTLVAIAVASKWPEAEIHYTIDGTTPTKNSPSYKTPFGVWKTGSVRAIAYSTGYVSPVVRDTFILVTPTPAPVFDTTIAPYFADSVKVALFAASDMGIRYTVDGSTPTLASPLYTGAFWLKNTATVKAFCGTRNPSAVVMRTYSLDGTPRIAPDSGLLANQTTATVTMTSTSPEIRYTLDGTDPTTLSAGYTGALTLTTFPVTVKARAFWPQAAPSSVSVVTYIQTADGIVIPKSANAFVPVFPEILGIPGTMTDPRDGKVYRTTSFSSHTWMAENLNYSNNGTKGVCYGSTAASDTSCADYGRLYSAQEYSNVCPSGWSIPSLSEWNQLISLAGGSTAQSKLKSTQWGGTDDYWFNALPGGYYDTWGSQFASKGSAAHFWSGDNSSGEYMSCVMTGSNFSCSKNYIFNQAGANATRSSSVRCVKW